jgi:hypothetical protein
MPEGYSKCIIRRAGAHKVGNGFGRTRRHGGYTTVELSRWAIKPRLMVDGGVLRDGVKKGMSEPQSHRAQRKTKRQSGSQVDSDRQTNGLTPA